MKINSFRLIVLSNWISKILQAFLQIYTIKLLTVILGLDEYAIYTLLIALSGWIFLSDFGLGSSLQNFISECRVKNLDYNMYVGNTVSLAIIIFGILIVLSYPVCVYMAPLYLYKFNICVEDKIFLLYTTTSILL
jgi:putative O-antigen transporter